MRYLLKHGKKTRAIFYDREMARTAAAMFMCELIEEIPKKVASLQQPIESRFPSETASKQGVEEFRQFDASHARPSPRRLSIAVSYSVKHNIRHYIAHHLVYGKVTGETFDHDSAAHWFYKKLKEVWPAYVISK
jgi:hypothetical protein